MPPFVGRKRLSTSPVASGPPPPKKAKTAKTAAPSPSQPTRKAVPRPNKASSRSPLEIDSDSSLSDVDSDEFEDIPQTFRPRQAQQAEDDEGIDDDEEDEDVEWEDAPAQRAAPDFSNREFKDIKITVEQDDDLAEYIVRPPSKKGPSRREKEARMLTHKMHVQFLLWHNAKRNAWINDQKVHQILLRHLPPQIVREIDKWKRASGLVNQDDAKPPPEDKKKKGKKWKANGERNERDWGPPSQRLDEGKPDMSHGDPIIVLLNILAAFWKKKFVVTAPGLRKRGYGTKLGLRKDIDSYRTDQHHPAKHGEKIASIEAFRTQAEKCEGSRDLGAQLFTALLRAIGIEARLVASLQPAGFGFTKVEEMVPRKTTDPDESTLSSHSERQNPPQSAGESAKKSASQRPLPKRSKGGKSAPIDLDTDASTVSGSGDDSIVDVTPTMPKRKSSKYDRDLTFPTYWAEAVSPITSTVYPVSPFILEKAVATSPELLTTFEPRGLKAEKTRQVMAYVVAYSPDRSAKDVTIRYLRKRIWPGKTKGFRVPVYKIPVYDKRGKIKRYEDYDWFKHVLGFYRRSDAMRTAVDDVEDATDLVAAEPEKKQVEGDTLQSLKQSADFVLEKHLRREEALLPGAKPDRYFTAGKGDRQQQIPVYKRSDVRRVMTAESWHKEGRAPKEGEAPMKLAPVRAVTLARKREAEAHFVRTGEKQMQGLYSEEQTDWIIPPPIENGVIPKNAYGNIDCFVPSMIPKGAVHLPLKASVRICKKLEIDFAEAVVGFEFGNKMAVPVIHGVVVAKENEKAVRDAWRQYNDEQRKKEESKMEKLVLEMWRKMVVGLRIRARVSEEYGVAFADTGLKIGAAKDQPITLDDDKHDVPGGFIPEHEEDEFGGGFLVDHEDEVHHGGDLMMEAPAASQEKQEPFLDSADEIDASQEYPTPVSAAASTKKQRRHTTRENGVEDSESELPEMDMATAVAEDEHAGGFLQDEEDDAIEHSPSEHEPTPRPRAKTKQRSKQQTSSRRSSRPQASIAIPASTRKTPSRAAKSRIQGMDVDGADHSSDTDISSSTEQSESGPEIRQTQSARSARRKTEATSPNRAPAKRGRGRPKKSGLTQTTPGTKRRLLRKESAVVTSPYFEPGSD